MRPDPASHATAYYPELPDEPELLVDRWLANLRNRIDGALSRRSPDVATFAVDVRRHTERFSAGRFAAILPDLRYRLRRDGLRVGLMAECFGLYSAALSQHGSAVPSAEVLGAALFMVQGGIAELREASCRGHALGLAAFTHALRGTPVHVMNASDARAERVAGLLHPPLEKLGFVSRHVSTGMNQRLRREAYSAPVVCASYWEFASDYLRDRLRLGGLRGRLPGSLKGFSADARGRGGLMLAGLQCALIDDADVVMLDDALAPLAISAAADESQSRLLYEQALELARALEPESHFQVDENGSRLTDTGVERLARLVTPLGGIWAAPLRRNELIVTALDALHVLKRDRDYRVENGRVAFPKPQETDAEEPVRNMETLRKLVEVKEGCHSSGRRDVLARISVPRFLNRYLNVGGICAGAHGGERDLWALYRRRVSVFGIREAVPECGARVFTTGTAKWAAVTESVRVRMAEGAAVVIAVRSAEQANSGLEALSARGITPAFIRGAGDEAEQNASAQADVPGGIALVSYPAERTVIRDSGKRVPLHIIIAELRPTVREIAHLVRTFAATSCEVMLSLEDKAMEPYTNAVSGFAKGIESGAGGELPFRKARRLAKRAQISAEAAQALARRDVLSRDKYLKELLALSGARE